MLHVEVHIMHKLIGTFYYQYRCITFEVKFSNQKSLVLQHLYMWFLHKFRACVSWSEIITLPLTMKSMYSTSLLTLTLFNFMFRGRKRRLSWNYFWFSTPTLKTRWFFGVFTCLFLFCTIEFRQFCEFNCKRDGASSFKITWERAGNPRKCQRMSAFSSLSNACLKDSFERVPIEIGSLFRWTVFFVSIFGFKLTYTEIGVAAEIASR